MKEQNIFRMKKGALGLVLSVLLIAADQFTKSLAVSHLKNGTPFSLIDGVFELRYLENQGAAFGILQNQRTLFLVFTGILLCFILYVYLFRIPSEKRYLCLNLIAVLLFSGAIGNFIDRLLHNYVVDFFYFRLIDFPIFNVADIYVVVAAVLLIMLGLFYYKEEDYEKIFPSGKKKADDRGKQ